MDLARRRGTIIGLLLILYMVGSGAVDFLLGPAHGGSAPLAQLLGILTEAFWLSIAIAAQPILRPKTPIAAGLFVALGILILAVGILENGGIFALQAHLVVRMLHGVALLVFNGALYRMRAIPRPLAGAGIAASLLQIGALAAPFFGRDVIFPLLAPTGLCQLVLALWLIAKGIRLDGGTL